MSEDKDNRNLDLRTTPRSYRRGGVWVLVTILLVMVVGGYAWMTVRDAVIATPNTADQSVPAGSATESKP